MSARYRAGSGRITALPGVIRYSRPATGFTRSDQATAIGFPDRGESAITANSRHGEQ
jgi:hypothetical protein